MPLVRKGNDDLNIKISDILGRTIKTYQIEPSGEQEVKIFWDGTNNLGKTVSSGIYVCSVVFGDFTESRKMLFLK